ncbi:hypothetical protein [Kibdelosporangium phytohabitans]|uniref:hypothetical protein n=1 Tax=Kibdelosporangium phytohabitans TaxID=860235 RepID=UPI0012F89022|nr:hypothetical protein [Kibdelosporangium phytohabitans]MBE1468916.1 hypothetical protein [Kibdelosporangium phytohabitans]
MGVAVDLGGKGANDPVLTGFDFTSSTGSLFVLRGFVFIRQYDGIAFPSTIRTVDFDSDGLQDIWASRDQSPRIASFLNSKDEILRPGPVNVCSFDPSRHTPLLNFDGVPDAGVIERRDRAARSGTSPTTATVCSRRRPASRHDEERHQAEMVLMCSFGKWRNALCITLAAASGQQQTTQPRRYESRRVAAALAQRFRARIARAGGRRVRVPLHPRQRPASDVGQPDVEHTFVMWVTSDGGDKLDVIGSLCVKVSRFRVSKA